MQDAEERRLSRMSNTSQGGATEGNTADDTLMVDQGPSQTIDSYRLTSKNKWFHVYFLILIFCRMRKLIGEFSVATGEERLVIMVKSLVERLVPEARSA